MGKVRYNLEIADKEGLSRVTLNYSFYLKHGSGKRRRLRWSTGLYIKPCDWNKETQRPIKKNETYYILEYLAVITKVVKNKAVFLM